MFRTELAANHSTSQVPRIAILVGLVVVLVGCTRQDSMPEVDLEFIAMEADYVEYLETSSGGLFWIFTLPKGDRSTGTLVEFDPTTLETGRSYESRGLLPKLTVLEEDAIWVVDQEAENVPRIGPTPKDDDAIHIVRFDTKTWKPINRFASKHIIPEDFVYLDGYLWSLHEDLVRKIDLATGLGTRLDTRGFSLYFGVNVWDGYLWEEVGLQIRKRDPKTGEAIFTLFTIEDPQVSHLGIQYYLGKYWVLGDAHDQPGVALEINPDTGQLSNPTPPSEIPSYNVELGDYRWEHYSHQWTTAYIDVSTGLGPVDSDSELPPALWKQVDLATGEIVGEFNFGKYTPFTIVDGYLWLHDAYDNGNFAIFHDVKGPGSGGLARVKLDELPAQAVTK